MNFIKKTVPVVIFTTSAFFLGASGASAAIVNIDLSGASTGSSITAVGGSFAQTFNGQTVAGIGISGTPSNPLMLAPSGSISVSFWDPGVSAASNSLLPQPENSAPLSLLLDSAANSITWTMGSASGGSIDVDLFGLNGALVNHASFNPLNNGYSVYSISGLGTFNGLTFKNDTDSSGLRFMNFSYNAVPVPEPEMYAQLLGGLGLLGFVGRRRKQNAA